MANQDAEATSRMMKDVDRFEKRGLSLLADPNRLKKLSGYKDLYELKTYFRGVYYRMIFTIYKGEAWLLEAFKKKSDDTPKRYLKTAEARKQILELEAL
jgi:phage-related protein